MSTHPRTRNRLEVLLGAGWASTEGLRFLPPFGFLDYVRLELDARCVISDSGTITEEAAILGFPAVTIREAHERPEGMDSGVLVMSGVSPERLLQAVRVVSAEDRGSVGTVPDYAYRNVSDKVVRILYSYVDWVQRNVWRAPTSG